MTPLQTDQHDHVVTTDQHDQVTQPATDHGVREARQPVRDLRATLREAEEFSDPSHRAIFRMWAVHADLQRAGVEFAEAKTRHERLLSKKTLELRAGGERSAAICEHHAVQDEEVYVARVQYRAAEQRITADREALKILHAELDAERTRHADDRAAGAWQARSQP